MPEITSNRLLEEGKHSDLISWPLITLIGQTSYTYWCCWRRCLGFYKVIRITSSGALQQTLWHQFAQFPTLTCEDTLLCCIRDCWDWTWLGVLFVYGVKPTPRSSVICPHDWVETHWELSLRCQQRLAVSARQVYDLGSLVLLSCL